MWTSDIPATIEGLSRSNVANALAATAIAYVSQVPPETIRQGLRSFETSFEQCPGRMNIYDKLPFRVIMDYAHNPAGMENMADFVSKMRPRYNRVIGVLSGTGDRRDQDLIRMGELIGGMVDKLIIKEDERRGRAPGETSALLRQGALQVNLPVENISIVMAEQEAVRTALSRAEERDLVLIFASKVNNVWRTITSFQPEGLSAPAADVGADETANGDGTASGDETENGVRLEPATVGASNSS
jgi:cyanophycin synthetase